MNEYLSEIEKSALDRFVSDETMREAVKKVILSGVYDDGVLREGKPSDPLKNFMLAYFTSPQGSLLPAEEKGYRLEAILNAISMVETGFKNLDKYKSVKSPLEVTVNKAR